jgi:UDPglucose 6-dehydrogenase
VADGKPLGAGAASVRICVYGLWHLGSVTAACLADAGFPTIGLDPQLQTIAGLSQGRPPLFEPGLEALTRAGLATGRLSFTSDPASVADVDVVWVTFDTPVDDDDRADAAAVIRSVEGLFPHLKNGAVVLVSSQLPVGSTYMLEKAFAAVARGRRVAFAYSPENLRLGKAIDVFTHPERIIIGTRDPHARTMLEPMLARFCSTLIWISIESAEMTKHALNAFLATSVTFMNEIATVCEQVGADAAEVELALRSEPRIGQRAYIRPGAAFAGGTLARDVMFLTGIGSQHDLTLPLLSAIIPSNKHHRQWSLNQLLARLGGLAGRRIAVLGLTYKPGTDSLRRSPGVKLCRQLVAEGAIVSAHDPAAEPLPVSFAADLVRTETAAAALDRAEAVVIATEWPDYRALTPEELFAAMVRPLILDQGRFLADRLAGDARFQYVTVGTPMPK